MKRILTLAVLALTLSTSGCIGVGYSNRGGWFAWPGGLGLLILIIVVVLFMRRRR